MIFKRSPFAIQDKNLRDLDHTKDYSNKEDLMKKQEVSNEDTHSVHHRRDLDSLG